MANELLPKYRANMGFPKPQALIAWVNASQTISARDLLVISSGRVTKAGAAATGVFALACEDIATGVRATGTLTFSGVAVDNQTVTIGDTVFELTVDGVYTAGRVPVSIADTAADTAVVALANAINNIANFDFQAVSDTSGDTVVITAKSCGTAYNGVATTETCTNAAWGATSTASGTNVSGMKEEGDFIRVQPLNDDDIVCFEYTGGVPKITDLFTVRYDIDSTQKVNLSDTTGGFLIPVSFDLGRGIINCIVDKTALWNA
jgi:hypothetical protein